MLKNVITYILLAVSVSDCIFCYYCWTLLFSWTSCLTDTTLVLLMQGACWSSRWRHKTRDKVARCTVGSIAAAKFQSRADTIHSNCHKLKQWHSHHQI